MAKKKPGARESSDRPRRASLDLFQHPENIARSSRGDRPIAPTAGGGSGAKLDFEAQLWAAAKAPRLSVGAGNAPTQTGGSMGAAEYKRVVLGLVFLNYISDAFEAHHAKLEAGCRQGADPEVPALSARRCEKRQAGQGDSFTNDRFPDLNADYILANPPFNMKRWGGEHLRPACRACGAGREDKRWKYGVPPAGNANFAWVQHMLDGRGGRPHVWMVASRMIG